MAARLTDKQKKKIIADYSENCNYRATARQNNVSDRTVCRICKNEPKITQKVMQKKVENTADMLAYMDSRKEQAQGIIDCCLSLLPKKLEEASAAQTATVMGITIDKFVKNTSISDDALKKLDEVLKEIGGVI